MKFDCLVWYSKLALSPEDNDFVSNFLKQGCKIKGLIPISLIGIAMYLYKKIQRNREDILLDRDI